MRRTLSLLLGLLLSAAPAAAQRPLLATTAQTTDTTANSVLVGCAVGSTTCTGGVKAGPISGSTVTATGVGSFGSVAVTSGETIGGTLAVSGVTTLSAAAAALRIGSAGAPQQGIGKIEFFSNTGYAPWGTTNTGATTDEHYWQFIHGSNFLAIRAVNDANNVTIDALTVSRVATTSMTVTTNASLIDAGILSPAGLGAGTTQNYAPTGLAGVSVLRLVSGAGLQLGGLTGGTNGRRIKICNADAVTTLGITTEDVGSTAANRFVATGATNTNIATGSCVEFYYDGVVSRWVGSWGSK